MKRINANLAVILISIVLLFVPFAIWGNKYLVGGDDTRLYYIFPMDFIKNYAVNIASDNTLAGAMTGYASVAYYIPFFLFIYMLKLIPFVNTQTLMYGLNLSLGFFAFYKLLGLYVKNRHEGEKLISILGALFYIFSTYIVKTHFNNQMISMYLVSLLPACLYLFILSVRNKKFIYTGVAVLIFSIFSTTINTLPWWGGFVITSIPLLIYEFRYNKRTFIRYSIYASTLFLLLNSYWIFHYIYQLFVDYGEDSVLQIYNSKNFINDNLRIVTFVSKLLNPANIIFNKMEFGSLTVSMFDMVPLFVLVVGIFLSHKTKSKTKLLFNTILFGYLISWFLLSPNLGDLGLRGFLFLSKHIPYFTMFRNMFDKFSISLAMYIAFLISFSLILTYQKNKIIFKYFLVLLSAYLFFISIPQYVNVSLKTKESYSLFNGKFNQDFDALVKYFNSSDDQSKILWLPLTSPAYLNISGENNNEFYSGLSPIKILTGKTDYAGKYSFIVGNDFFLGDEVFKMINDKDYQALGELFKSLNIAYVICSNEDIPARLRSFQYGGNDLPVLKMQDNKELKDVLLGEHIEDFGNRYSLYKINQKYTSYKVYLEKDGVETPLTYKKINSEKYVVDVSNAQTGNVVFSELKSNHWVLKDGSGLVPKVDSNDTKNIWNLGVETQNQKMYIEFVPGKYSIYFYIVSGATFSIASVFLLVSFIRRRYKA
jgi:hypothetical protein